MCSLSLHCGNYKQVPTDPGAKGHAVGALALGVLRWQQQAGGGFPGGGPAQAVEVFSPGWEVLFTH